MIYKYHNNDIKILLYVYTSGLNSTKLVLLIYRQQILTEDEDLLHATSLSHPLTKILDFKRLGVVVSN